MHEESALLSAIAVGDDTARLAYADWLEEHGDTRAAWVRDPVVWRWMAPDAHDPVPSLLAALSCDDWPRKHNAQAALPRIGAPAVAGLIEIMRQDGQSTESAYYAGEALGAMQREAVEPVLPILCELAANEDENICGPAIEAMKAVGNAAVTALPALIAALELGYDDDHALAKSAAVVLRNIGPPALDAVRDLLILASEWSTEADEALVAIGPAAVPIILREIPEIDSDFNTLNAVNAVKRMGGKVVPALREALRSEADSVREFASLVLAEFDPEAALLELVAGLERNAGHEQRDRDRHFADALRNLGPLAAPAAETMRRLVPVLGWSAQQTVFETLAKLGDAEVTTMNLIDQLSKSGSVERLSALIALHHVKDLPSSAVTTILDLLDDVEDVSNEARKLIGQLVSGPLRSHILPTLLTLVRHRTEEVAVWACKLLSRYTDADTQTALRAALVDPRPLVRVAALEALAGSGDAALTSEYVRLCVDTDLRVRVEAVQRLSDTGPMSAAVAQAIRTALSDDVDVRRQAVLAAGVRGPVQIDAVEQLVNMAREDDSPEVRSAAVGLLPSCGMPLSDVVARLRRCLAEDAEEDVRRSAAFALAEVASQPGGNQIAAQAVPELVVQLEEDDAKMAISALGRIGPAVIPTLLAVLHVGSDVVKKHACEALAELGTHAVPAVEALAAQLTSPDFNVREHAAWALAAIGPQAATAIGPLRRLLWADTDDQILAALTALAQIGATACFSDLARMKHDAEPLAATTLWASCRLGERSAVMELLRGAVNSPHPAVRAVAAVERARHGGLPATPTELCAACVVPGLRAYLLDELAQRGSDPAVLSAAAETCRQGDHFIHSFGMEVVARVGVHNPTAAIAALRRSPHCHSHVILWGLAQFGAGSREALGLLQSRIASYHPRSRAMGIVTLRAMLA